MTIQTFGFQLHDVCATETTTLEIVDAWECETAIKKYSSTNGEDVKSSGKCTGIISIVFAASDDMVLL